MTGVRNGVTNTLGPNLSRLVRAATAAIAVIGSGTGRGEDSRSENHTESISLFSHRSTNCQKKSRPAGPEGHGPGITPMRYLMRITATLAWCPAPGRAVQGQLAQQTYKTFDALAMVRTTD